MTLAVVYQTHHGERIDIATVSPLMSLINLAHPVPCLKTVKDSYNYSSLSNHQPPGVLIMYVLTRVQPAISQIDDILAIITFDNDSDEDRCWNKWLEFHAIIPTRHIPILVSALQVCQSRIAMVNGPKLGSASTFSVLAIQLCVRPYISKFKESERCP